MARQLPPTGSMNAAADNLWVLEHYGLVILPALVAAEQLGVPLPAVPALLGFGALAATGRVNIPLVLGVMAVVTLGVDFGWYELGRRRGADILAGLCRWSPELESCVRRSQNLFARYGVSVLLVAKFVPGLTTVVAPLAGLFAVRRARFLLYDTAGLVLWAGLWISVGRVFSAAVMHATARVAAVGLWLALVVVAVLGAYVVLKYVRRRLFLSRLEAAAVPCVVPGSRWAATDQIDEPLAEILETRDLVL